MSAPTIGAKSLAVAIDRVALLGDPGELTGEDAPRVAERLKLPVELVAAAIAQLTGRKLADVEHELPGVHPDGKSAPPTRRATGEVEPGSPAPEPVDDEQAAPQQHRSARAGGRRRGVVPNNLRERVDQATPDFRLRLTARFIAGSLDGLPPSALTPEELADLREMWGAEEADQALQILADLGYGARPKRRSRAQRAHGVRREARLQGVLGKLPRSLALRLPTTADTHRSGSNDGVDRWGRVTCSHTLRAEHLGLLAAAGGLWHARAGDGDDYVDTTAGELVHLLGDERRVSGKSIARIHERLGELETLDLRADVNDRPGKDDPKSYKVRPNGFSDFNVRSEAPSGASEAHRIPGPPIERVERRLGDRWVSLAEYDAASRAAADEDLAELSAAERAGCAGLATIRIHLAPWFRAELAHPQRRPVFINFDVWRHLWPSSRRLYAFVQGQGRDDYDGRIYFYLAPPTLYTLGISTERLDRAAAAVSHDLTAIWHADERYHCGSGFRRHKHADTKWPAFGCDAARRRSAPTAKAMATKSPPKRPSDLRGACGRLRRHSILDARGRSVDELDQAHVRRVGVEAAKREAELVRQAVQRSLGDAAATSRQPGPFEPSRAAAWARRQGTDDDDDADG